MPAKRPEFAPAETAWLSVPYSRTSGLKMTLSGVALAAFSIANAISGQLQLVAALQWTLGLLGGLMVFFGLSATLRGGPVLTADADGITASFTGMDRSHLPWELITGATIVGKSKLDRSLVILTSDVDAARKRVYPAIASGIRRNNSKYGVPGGMYVLVRVMGSSAEAAAARINELAADLAPELATSPAGTSRSSHPA